MTMQTDLQAAVDKATAASAKLHDVVHGDAVSTVTTESGPVKTVAKTIADNEAAIDASRIELDQKVTDAVASALAASTSASAASTSATSAAASASAASTSAGSAATDAASTAADVISTAADAASTAADAISTAADATATALDAAATAADATASAASAAAASTSATNAATSASTAATSETNSAASAAAAAASAASGLYSAVQEKSADYTFVSTDQGDLIKVDTSGGNVVLTLDALATIGADSRCAVQKTTADANTVTVQRSSTDTINNGTSVTLTAQWEHWHFVGDASTGLWTGHNMVASALSGGDGIDKTGNVVKVDRAASNSGLEFSGGKLQTTAAVRSHDMPFLAGYANDYAGENITVAQHGHYTASRSGTFSDETGYIETPATGQALICDVRKNGVSIYSTLPQFAATANTLTAGVIKSDGTESYVKGDRITFHVTQVGSGTIGQKASFTGISEVTN